MKHELFQNGLRWFCKNLKENSWHLIGSSTDYFYVDYPIFKINDFDILIDSTIYSPKDISNLTNVSEFDYWGGATYISNTLQRDVYRSLLEIDDNKIIIDWVFSDTQDKITFTNFGKLIVPIQNLNERVNVLKGIINKRTKSALKAKDKFHRYKTKTLI